MKLKKISSGSAGGTLETLYEPLRIGTIFSELTISESSQRDFRRTFGRNVRSHTSGNSSLKKLIIF